VLGLGTTDAIGGDVAAWAGAIVTAYVGSRSLEKIARTLIARRETARATPAVIAGADIRISASRCRGHSLRLRGAVGRDPAPVFIEPRKVGPR
jgi:hypothetical protein